jgi:hypothetical protein
MRDGYQRKTNEIFIARKMSRGYSNVCHIGSHTPTRVRHFKNHASCASYPDGKLSNFSEKKVHRDMMAMQLSICMLRTRQCVSNTSSTQCSIGKDLSED